MRRHLFLENKLQYANLARKLIKLACVFDRIMMKFKMTHQIRRNVAINMGIGEKTGGRGNKRGLTSTWSVT